jgi:asparaginyl-tRNA synthetase
MRTTMPIPAVPAPRALALPAWSAPDRFLALLEHPWFRLLVDLQDCITTATVEHWSRLGMRTLHLPVTTGAVSSPMGRGSDSLPVEVEMFGVPTYLADSMQFMLEYGCRLADRGCYYVMPSFRGEAADATHLCQFYHSEMEIPGGLDDAMDAANGYVAALARAILERSADGVRAFAGTTAHVESLAEGRTPVHRLAFDEAAALLQHDPACVRPGGGGWRTLTREGETRLLRRLGGFVWVTDWDHLAVPFYQAFHPGDEGRARNGDLLFGLGEIIGCGERHTDAAAVERALALHGVPAEPYAWYRDLKARHPLRTAGFGMGVERFLMWVLNHRDIRDLQILPRSNGAALNP